MFKYYWLIQDILGIMGLFFSLRIILIQLRHLKRLFILESLAAILSTYIIVQPFKISLLIVSLCLYAMIILKAIKRFNNQEEL